VNTRDVEIVQKTFKRLTIEGRVQDAEIVLCKIQSRYIGLCSTGNSKKNTGKVLNRRGVLFRIRCHRLERKVFEWLAASNQDQARCTSKWVRAVYWSMFAQHPTI
jgi:hypothetical protein